MAKKKPGPEPEVFKVSRPFEDAVKIALNKDAKDAPKPPRKKRKLEPVD